MANFKYDAVDEAGAERSGAIDAETMVAARTTLADQGLRVTDLREHKKFFSMQVGRKRIAPAEIMNLSRQLAAFIRAGVPILDALEVFGEESGSATLRDVMRDVREALRGGETLSGAIEPHAAMFPAFYLEMLRAAELTGKLDFVLDQLARYIERDLEAKRKIRSALAYPAVIGVASLGTVVIMTAFVLPRFRKFFEGLGATLPLPTRLLLGFTGFISTWWWAITAILAATGTALYFWMRTDGGMHARDKFLLRLPVVGDLVRYSTIERFCRIMASMVQAGVSLPEAVSVIGRGINNTIYRDALVEVREEMLQGEGIARPISRTGLFPSSVTQMIRVGEDTGTLDEQLKTAADFFDQELEFKIKRMTTLFEPAVIIFMGVVVGFVAIALISAMYGIFSQSGSVG